MLEIIPTKIKSGISINVPGSKSVTNRALLIAALCKGTSTINNSLISDDTRYMQEALSKLGVSIKVDGMKLKIKSSGNLQEYREPLFLGNAGTAVRFLTAACTLGKAPYIITGDPNMQKRPIHPLVKALQSNGLKIHDTQQCPPVYIEEGKFQGGKIVIDGSLSSQFISALLMIAPKSTVNDTQIIIQNELTSKPYIDVTIDIMREFGVEVVNNNYQSFAIQCNREYTARDFTVEGDYSSASYFAALAVIHKTKINLKNLNANSTQGDKRFIELLQQMGADVKWRKNHVSIRGQQIKNIGTIDMNDIPDMVPTMAILAAVTDGETIITNVSNLRVKETDRLQALENELYKIGVKVKANKDSITIWGNRNNLKGATIETYHDHRIAMSFACLGSIIDGIKIINPDCVQKSYPDFWQDITKLGLKFKST